MELKIFNNRIRIHLLILNVSVFAISVLISSRRQLCSIDQHQSLKIFSIFLFRIGPSPNNFSILQKLFQHNVSEVC